MPLVKKKLSVASGARSEQVLAGTDYEYVGGNTRLLVAACTDTEGSAAADNLLNFSVNNTVFSNEASLSAKSTAVPFGAFAPEYQLNDTTTSPNSVRNRPTITIQNNTAATRTYDVAVFIQ